MAGHPARPRRRRARRGLAGLLGRLRRRPGVHRHAGRACSSSAAPTSTSATPTRCRSPRTSRSSARGYLPEVGPDTGYNNLTLLLGLAASPSASSSARVRSRRSPASRCGADVERRCGSCGCASAVMLRRDHLRDAALRARPRRHAASRSPASSWRCWSCVYGFIPQPTVIGRHIYAVGGNRRAAELSGVKTQAGQLPRHDEHVGPGRPRRHDLRGPLDRLRPAGRRRLGARRHRGRLHRWRGRLRRCRHRRRLDRRWPRHGRAQQRPAAQGIGADATQIIKGLVLLVAVAFDVYNKSQGRFSLIGMLTRNFRRGGTDDDTSAPPPPSAAPRRPRSPRRSASPAEPPARPRRPGQGAARDRARSAHRLDAMRGKRAHAYLHQGARRRGCGRPCSDRLRSEQRRRHDAGRTDGGPPPRASPPTPSSASPCRRRPRRTGCSPASCSTTA